MADEIDAASERVEAFNNNAIQAVLLSQPNTPGSGVCYCGEVIDAARLKANPNARLCRDCAQEEEEERKRAKRAGRR